MRCAFPMVVYYILLHTEIGPNDYQKDALHFNRMRSFETIVWNWKHKAGSLKIYFPINRLCFQSEMILSKLSFLFPMAFPCLQCSTFLSVSFVVSNIRFLFQTDIVSNISYIMCASKLPGWSTPNRRPKAVPRTCIPGSLILWFLIAITV